MKSSIMSSLQLVITLQIRSSHLCSLQRGQSVFCIVTGSSSYSCGGYAPEIYICSYTVLGTHKNILTSNYSLYSLYTDIHVRTHSLVSVVKKDVRHTIALFTGTAKSLFSTSITTGTIYIFYVLCMQVITY